jgi:hypothetical protein
MLLIVGVLWTMLWEKRDLLDVRTLFLVSPVLGALSVDNNASGTRPDDPVRALAMCERPVTVEYFGWIMRPAL